MWRIGLLLMCLWCLTGCGMVRAVELHSVASREAPIIPGGTRNEISVQPETILEIPQTVVEIRSPELFDATVKWYLDAFRSRGWDIPDKPTFERPGVEVAYEATRVETWNIGRKGFPVNTEYLTLKVKSDTTSTDRQKGSTVVISIRYNRLADLPTKVIAWPLLFPFVMVLQEGVYVFRPVLWVF